ncbi:MAG: hypothetical protein MST10_07835 [Lentisphaeria bacterium]|nr:hypothetical protein [Lentisphaeria bacterium]
MKCKYSLLTMLLIGSMAVELPLLAAVSPETQKLIKEAEAVARTNDVEKSVAAYGKVLAAADADDNVKFNACLNLAKVYQSKNMAEKAAAEYAKAIAMPNITAAQKYQVLSTQADFAFRSNFPGSGFGAYNTDGIESALKYYQQAAQLTGLTNKQKIEVAQRIANCYLELMDEAKATETVAEATKLSDLNADDKYQASNNLANTLYRQGKYEAALKIYQSMWNKDLHIHKKRDTSNRIIECLGKLNRNDDALKAAADMDCPPSSLAAIYLAKGQREQAGKIYTAVVNDSKAGHRERMGALSSLALLTFDDTRDGAKVVKIVDDGLKKIHADNAGNERATREIYGEYNRQLASWMFNRNGLMYNPQYAAFINEKLSSVPNPTPADVANFNRIKFNQAIRDGKFGDAAKIAADYLAISNPDKKFKREMQICAVLLNNRDGGKKLVPAVKTLALESGVKADDAKGIADFYQEAATLALSMHFDEAARSLIAGRDAMQVKPEFRKMGIPFVQNGPKDISGFMNYLKTAKNVGKLDRKYGPNLQFLLDTDATFTGRKVTADTANATPTEFIALCDEDGVKIFFYAKSPKAKEFADGFGGIGGYEVYLASGANDPYNCFLIDLPPYKGDDKFPTQYNNANYRRTMESNNTCSITSQAVDGGAATLVAMPWHAFFNRIPQNGTEWDFEAMHWDRGGYSWGGSESVHNRSSFGRLVFENLTPANLTAIKRRVLAKAKMDYNREWSANNGYGEIWMDPELGDRTFYLEVVEPVRKELDAYAAKIKPDMSDADVNQVFDEAGARLMNIKFDLAKMRADYLAKQMTE